MPRSPPLVAFLPHRTSVQPTPTRDHRWLAELLSRPQSRPDFLRSGRDGTLAAFPEVASPPGGTSASARPRLSLGSRASSLAPALLRIGTASAARPATHAARVTLPRLRSVRRASVASTGPPSRRSRHRVSAAPRLLRLGPYVQVSHGEVPCCHISVLAPRIEGVRQQGGCLAVASFGLRFKKLGSFFYISKDVNLSSLTSWACSSLLSLLP